MSTSTSLESLGSLISEKRGKTGLRATAAVIGVSPATLSRIESGQLPDLANFRKICQWLEIDPAAVLLRHRVHESTRRLSALPQDQDDEPSDRLRARGDDPGSARRADRRGIALIRCAAASSPGARTRPVSTDHILGWSSQARSSPATSLVTLESWSERRMSFPDSRAKASHN